MVKSTLRNRGTSSLRRFECDYKIEAFARYLASTSCDHARWFVVRGVNGTLVRMGWQKAYCPSWGHGICKDGMDRLDDHDFLKIPIRA
jgi:hypothetical protein